MPHSRLPTHVPCLRRRCTVRCAQCDPPAQCFPFQRAVSSREALHLTTELSRFSLHDAAAWRVCAARPRETRAADPSYTEVMHERDTMEPGAMGILSRVLMAMRGSAAAACVSRAS